MSRLEEVAYQLTSSPFVATAKWLLLLLVPLMLLLRNYASRRRRSSSSCSEHKPQLPPSPRGLPIVGHLHLVGDLPHVSLRDLSAKHGCDGLMHLCLGAVPTVVVSSPRAAEAIMRTYDHVFASRPASTVGDDLLYGSCDISLSPYGEHWRQARKLVTTHLFTVKKVRSYRSARKEESTITQGRSQKHRNRNLVCARHRIEDEATNEHTRKKLRKNTQDRTTGAYLKTEPCSYTKELLEDYRD